MESIINGVSILIFFFLSLYIYEKITHNKKEKSLYKAEYDVHLLNKYNELNSKKKLTRNEKRHLEIISNYLSKQ